jgi:hypothetical protein
MIGSLADGSLATRSTSGFTALRFEAEIWKQRAKDSACSMRSGP